jgi:dipeptidyl aminopeptidase/acylaminoacyl peptidase
MRARAAILLLTLVSLAPAAPLTAQQAAGRAFTPADWYRVTTVGGAALSPDGRQVAFTVTTTQEAENRRHTEIWMVPTAGGEPRRLTAPGVTSTNPRWSHDGRFLLFTSTRPGGRGSTWILQMDVPAGEAFQAEYPTGSLPRDARFAVFTAPADSDSAA